MNIRFHRKILLISVFVFTIFAAPACSKPSETELAMAQAEEHITQGEYTAAESVYHDILADDDNPDTTLALVDLYITWQRPESGLNTLDTAIENDIIASDTVTRQLTLLLMDKQWTRAVDLAQMHLAENPGNSLAVESLFTASLNLNNCAKAATVSKDAWLADREDENWAFNYSILHGDAQILCQVDRALCGIAVNCGSFCYVDIGEELIRMNAWALASCVLEEAIKYERHKALAHIWLAESLTRIDQVQSAERYFYSAVELDPTNPLGWLLLGTHTLKQGDWETARAALLNAQRLDPENPAPCLSIAELKAAQGLYPEVDTWVKAALERASNDIDIWKAAVRIYLTRNLVQTDLPGRIADSAVHLDQQDAEAHMLLGWTFLLTGDNRRALPEIDRAVDLDPSLGHAFYLRGIILEQEGKLDLAETAFTRAADLGYFP